MAEVIKLSVGDIIEVHGHRFMLTEVTSRAGTSPKAVLEHLSELTVEPEPWEVVGHIPYGDSEKVQMGERFTKWYDRQSIETLFLVGVSPLIALGVILVLAALMYGR